MRFIDLELDVYQGPFDLLFTLVLKDEVDILEIPVFDVILAYVEHVAAGDDADWESLSEFLVLISSLLQVKARRLLPGPALVEDAPSPDEARHMLVERILAYQQCRRAAEYLATRASLEAGRILRLPDRPGRVLLAPDDVVKGSESAATLVENLLAIWARQRRPNTVHLTSLRVEMKRQIGLLRRLLRSRARLSFNEAFGDSEPLVQAVTVLALLNLISKGEVKVHQTRPFGDIIIKAIGAPEKEMHDG
ncbi:MAG: segregation/condensation protein A [Actinobacteria bacterium]|nr:segregation/condensation protein A [Actinomycetota bacterium]